MTASGDWLLDILAANAWRNLDTEASRRELAEKIVEAFPRKAAAVVIAGSAACVLKQRGIRDGAGDMSREIGNNSAQGLMCVIEPGVDIHVDLTDAERGSGE